MTVQERWGEGLATRAAALALALHASRPLVATVDEEHAASIRVLEKSGFVFASREFDEEGSYLVYALDTSSFSPFTYFSSSIALGAKNFPAGDL